MSNKYTLRYLPLFESDLNGVVEYISNTLHNPAAALRLVEDTEKAILGRLYNPLEFGKYNSFIEREHPYYRINIRNFSVFYVVIDDVMEIRRFIYNKRNIENLIY